MPKLPPTPVAWILFVSGFLALCIAMLVQWQMWLVVFEVAPVATGGGEYTLALFIGLPALLLSALLLGIATAKTGWRSRAAAALLALALAPLLGWLGLFIRSFAV